MATANSHLSVMLLGRTGQGKSTTGNILIGAGKEWIKQEWPDQAEGLDLSFLTNTEDTADSVTKHCSLLSSTTEKCEIRVLDTVGFADSKSRDVHLGNLQVAREIVGVSSELDMAFERVLYFLPNRGRPEKADATMQDEIKILWHFFGEAIFENMALVTTLDKQYPSMILEFLEPKESDVQTVFRSVMTLALPPGARPPSCPPTIFIPFDIDSAQLLKKVKEITVTEETKVFIPQFREGVCAKCACGLYWRDSTIVDVKIGERLVEPKNTMCHPLYIPKHSMIIKFLGGIAHILVLGMAKVHERRTGAATWPGFFNSEEVCAKCEMPPGSEGCMNVLQEYEEQVVQHDNKLNKVTQAIK